jgi:hypothetical protein
MVIASVVVTFLCYPICGLPKGVTAEFDDEGAVLVQYSGKGKMRLTSGVLWL